jgi:hypothetical protein
VFLKGVQTQRGKGKRLNKKWVYKNKEIVCMKIVSFAKYYRAEKFRKKFVQIAMKMGGKKKCKKNF